MADLDADASSVQTVQIVQSVTPDVLAKWNRLLRVYTVANQIQRSVMFAIYILSVYQAFHYQSWWLIKAIVIVPLFGQIVWFGAMWQLAGFFNVYTYVYVSALIYGAWVKSMQTSLNNTKALYGYARDDE